MLRRIFIAMLLSVAFLVWGLLTLPSRLMHAQDVPLVTNTPRALATNTPQPPAPMFVTPDAPLENYALRLWSEDALVELLLRQVQGMSAADNEARLAIGLTQYELERRFPGAPRSLSAREQLLQVLLAAPPASVDMRAVVRPYLESVLATSGPALDLAGALEWQGWHLDWTPANVDNRPPLDALLHAVYRTDNADNVLYEDYTFVAMTSPGVYRIFPASYPVAPLGSATAVRLYRLGDATGDSGDEAVLLVETDDLNQRLYIFGWRGDGVVDLVAPGQPAFLSEILEWRSETRSFVANVVRVNSPRWGCLSQGIANWAYTFNFYRVSDDGVAFADQPSLACMLFATEPLFDKPLSDAIRTVENLYAIAENDPAAHRARLMLAVLYALDGQTESASALAFGMSDAALRSQASALQSALARGDTPAQICAAVVRAAPMADVAFCDVDDFLSRLFSEQPLNRQEPIRDQLASLGIAVREQVTLRQIGRFDRQAVSFDLAGLRWWAFAPLDEEFLTAEAIQPPVSGDTEGHSARALRPAQRAVDALFAGDLPAALVALDNAVRERPDAPLSPEFIYVRALTRDLVGDRVGARQDYYTVWSSSPATIWGMLAAGHLERR